MIPSSAIDVFISKRVRVVSSSQRVDTCDTFPHVSLVLRFCFKQLMTNSVVRNWLRLDGVTETVITRSTTLAFWQFEKKPPSAHLPSE